MHAPNEIALSLRGGSAPSRETCWLRVPDVQGSYTIPHIQSSPRLAFRLSWGEGMEWARLCLLRGDALVAEQRVASPASGVTFPDLSPGEYRLLAEVQDREGVLVGRTELCRIGIGTVLAALGDSITEGYLGRGFYQHDLDLRAEAFPPEAVSRDGRNYPQFAPTTKTHLPVVNCFQSWLPALNDGLARAWGHPVFLANEGWGGITSGGYLARMREDANWRERMQLLRPRVWLLHLGVNDERALVSAGEFAANMEAIVDTLLADYQADPERIFLARPCYDYWEGAAPILAEYCARIEALVARRGLQPGPDFFAAYAEDRERWYGADPVHPNLEGMERMAGLWLESLVRAWPEGPPR